MCPIWPIVKLNSVFSLFSVLFCFTFAHRAGKKRDGGGGHCPGVAPSLHHREEGAEHRADHTAAAAGEETTTAILPLHTTGWRAD